MIKLCVIILISSKSMKSDTGQVMEIKLLSKICVLISPNQNVMGTPVPSPHSLSSVTENQGEQQT